jgi:two-component system, NarL family, sensor histidine kinase UhpB
VTTALPSSVDNTASSSGLFEGPSGKLLLAAREAIVMIDEAQTIAAMNPAAERLLGCDAAQVLGTSLDRFVPLRWREQHASMVRGFAASQTTQRMMRQGRRVELLRADGSTVPVEIALSRIEMADRGRTRTLFAAMLHDSSDAFALEGQLAALERRMRAVFELSPSAIWICDDDVLTYANRAAARLFGVATIDTLIGQRVWTLLDNDSHALLRQAIERTLSSDCGSATSLDPLEGRALRSGDLGARGKQTIGTIVAGRLTRSDGQRREIEIALAALPDHGHRTVQMVVSDVTDRRREATGLRELSASVVEAREEERRRIARELHDELGQRLTALKIDLATLAAQAPLSTDDPLVAGMQAMLDDTLASVRRIASDLRPLMLDDLGLNAAIEWLARDASRRIGIPVHTRLPLAEPAVDRRVATAIYRMVQEALTNVARHAQAQSVDVALQVQERQLVLTVGDDGVGLGEQALYRAGSFGLMGLRERAHMLGGTIDVGARHGGGTRLTVRLPLRSPSSMDSGP